MAALTAEVAQRIVDRTMAVIGRNVNVMDDHGLILATGHPDRLRVHHEAALVAAQQDRVVVVDADQARLLRGVQPGVNVPLHHHGAVVGVVGISGQPAEVQVFADLIRVAAELIVEQAASLESGQRLQQEREDVLVGVASGRVDTGTATRRCAELGIALDPRRGCTLVRPVDGDDVEVLRVLQRQATASRDLLVARTQPEEVAIWWPEAARVDVQRLLDQHEGRVRAADGELFAGVAGLRRAWLTAHDALAVSHLAEELYEPKDLQLVALLCTLRDDWRAEALSAPWRALVAADRHGELRATLRCWLQHGMQAAACAGALHVHRNTLRARLDRIEVVTGLDLRRVPSLLQLYVGPLLADTPPPHPTPRTRV